VRQNMRRVTQVLAVLLLISFIAMGFQNCAAYQPLTNGLTGENEGSNCFGSECAASAESLSLTLGNQTLPLPKPTTGVRDCSSASADPAWCVDVAGFCDSGGFADTKIYVQLKTGPTPVSEYLTNSRCDDMGRFQVSVPLPNGYDFTKFYEIEVRVEGVDNNGQPVRNPLPIDYASVGLIPSN
jgi:hypothetical protein